MRFDPHLPYAEIVGLPGVSWEQNGQLFRRDGCPVRMVDGEPVPCADSPDPVVEAVAAPAAAEAVKPRRGPRSTFGRMADAELRALLGVYGEEWQGRDAAVAYLEANGG